MTKASINNSISGGISNNNHNNNVSYSNSHSQTSTYNVLSSNGLVIGTVKEQQQIKPCVITKYRVSIQIPPSWKIHAIAKHIQKKKLSKLSSAIPTDTNMNTQDTDNATYKGDKKFNNDNDNNDNNNNDNNDNDNNDTEMNEMELEDIANQQNTSSSSSSSGMIMADELSTEPKPSTTTKDSSSSSSSVVVESNESEDVRSNSAPSSPVVSTEQVRRELENLNVKSLIVKKEIDSLNVVRSNLLWLLKKTVLNETIRNHNREK